MPYSLRVKVTVVAAARPNFMKVKPVLDALDAAGATSTLVHTGQHFDSKMSEIFFEELGLRSPDLHLGCGGGSHAEQTGRVMAAFEAALSSLPTDVVVVAGDVNSTLACAITAAKCGSLVAHVEAGLRSRDWSMPEEVNRVATDRVSDLLLAPSSDAVENLLREGYAEGQVALVGNVMIDTLLTNLDRAEPSRVLDTLGLAGEPFGLVTLHRPSNVDDEATFGLIAGALLEVAERLPLIFPVHPRTRPMVSRLESSPSVYLVEPLGYLDFIGLESEARLVLTDSGGVQEETTVLGVPCLTLRDNTERPITLSEGTNRLVGCEPLAIVTAVEETLTSQPAARHPELWDGHAGERIVAAIIDMHAKHEAGEWPRPTAWPS